MDYDLDERRSHEDHRKTSAKNKSRKGGNPLGLKPPKRRINLSHEFVKVIVRNQIDRDEYDKFVNERKDRLRAQFEGTSSGSKRRHDSIESGQQQQRHHEPSSSSSSSREHRNHRHDDQVSSSKRRDDDDDDDDERRGSSREQRPSTSSHHHSRDHKSTRSDTYLPPHARHVVERLAHDPAPILTKPDPVALVRTIEQNMIREKIRERLERQAASTSIRASPPPVERMPERPPKRSHKSRHRSKSTSQRNKPLFWLRFDLPDGKGPAEVEVLTNSCPARLAKAITREHGLLEEHCRELRELLESEISRRLDAVRAKKEKRKKKAIDELPAFAKEALNGCSSQENGAHLSTEEGEIVGEEDGERRAAKKSKKKKRRDRDEEEYDAVGSRQGEGKSVSSLD